MKPLLTTLSLCLCSILAHTQTTWLVTNKNDDGPGSLRQTIAAAATHDTISLRNLSSGTILLNSPIVTTDKSFHIVGSGSSKIKISGQDKTRLFLLSGISARKYSFTGVALVNGLAASGSPGAMIRFTCETLNACQLTLKNVVVENANLKHSDQLDTRSGAVSTANVHVNIKDSEFRNNVSAAPYYSNFSGGGAVGITNGNLTLESSTFAFNKGGGITIGPATAALQLAVVNCTFTGNLVMSSGAAIYADGSIVGDIRNATFFDNSYSTNGTTGNTLNCANCTVANTLFQQAGRDGAFISGGGNFYSSYANQRDPATSPPSDIFVASNNDIVVAPLAYSSGSKTRTHALKADTRVINAGISVNLPAYDQRGAPRVKKGRVDIGAFESDYAEVRPNFSHKSNCDGTVSFTNTTHDPFNFNPPYLWNFADGTTSTERSPTHRFAHGGSYWVTLTATTPSTQETSVPHVVYTEPMAPVVTLLGTNPKYHDIGKPYVDEGASARDDVSGVRPVTVTSNVQLQVPGTYETVYTAADACGNVSSRKRTVIVRASGVVMTTADQILAEGYTPLSVYPNPGANVVSLRLYSESAKTIPLLIISSEGDVRERRSVQLLQGINVVEQNVSTLKRGTYIIKAASEEVRFVKE